MSRVNKSRPDKLAFSFFRIFEAWTYARYGREESRTEKAPSSLPVRQRDSVQAIPQSDLAPVFVQSGSRTSDARSSSRCLRRLSIRPENGT